MKKLIELEEQMEEAGSKVSKLQKHEDSLSELVAEKLQHQKRRLSMKANSSCSHSAESTPKMTGEYHNLINELLDVTEQNEYSERNTAHIQKLLSRATECNDGKSESCHIGKERKKHKRKREREHVSTEDSSSSEEGVDSSPDKKSKKGKTLCSGKVARIEQLDIKKQVTYPHVRLNREFTSVRSFDELDLKMFEVRSHSKM